MGFLALHSSPGAGQPGWRGSLRWKAVDPSMPYMHVIVTCTQERRAVRSALNGALRTPKASAGLWVLRVRGSGGQAPPRFGG